MGAFSVPTGSSPNEVTAMINGGADVVLADDMEEGEHIASHFLKSLTSGVDKSVRRLYEQIQMRRRTGNIFISAETGNPGATSPTWGLVNRIRTLFLNDLGSEKREVDIDWNEVADYMHRKFYEVERKRHEASTPIPPLHPYCAVDSLRIILSDPTAVSIETRQLANLLKASENPNHILPLKDLMAAWEHKHAIDVLMPNEQQKRKNAVHRQKAPEQAARIVRKMTRDIVFERKAGYLAKLIGVELRDGSESEPPMYADDMYEGDYVPYSPHSEAAPISDGIIAQINEIEEANKWLDERDITP